MAVLIDASILIEAERGRIDIEPHGGGGSDDPAGARRGLPQPDGRDSGTSLKGQPAALVTWLAILAAGFVWYAATVAFKRRRGVHIEYAFAALPPE